MIELNYRDTRPLYQQIKSGIRRLIFTSAFRADEQLPTVRELAGSLAINPNTIQRAYRELEQEGYLYTLPGKGTFVSPADHTGSTERQNELLAEFDETVSELLYLSVPAEELTGRISALSERMEPDVREPSGTGAGRGSALSERMEPDSRESSGSSAGRGTALSERRGPDSREPSGTGAGGGTVWSERRGSDDQSQ